ncbi:MAG: 4-hydroxythreonine-4-phosphate dehydrogenase PdxA [Rhodospirillaceae bacterium]|nr:4-hydroxythreonine-4-phosphate dehydrogenase PdxA [Rhodospirillaceae bacterium]
MTDLPMKKPALALTMGEPSGIGGEIALRTWLKSQQTRRSGEREIPPFFIIDDKERLSKIAATLDLPVPLCHIETPEDALACWNNALPVLALSEPVNALPGTPDPANAKAVLASIEHAVKLVGDGRASALVTNPIHKKTLADAGFPHPGHTEYLAEIAGTDNHRKPFVPAMMLAVPDLQPCLRVVPVTIHIPLNQVSATLTFENIVTQAQITARALETIFGIKHPRLAVAALNPHGGEEGKMGFEEIEIIAPAVDNLVGQGFDVKGPSPADTLFHAEARKNFDAIICMYHDQALIPLKTLDFENGVNITLGLPFIRTSPDHGTALDIAGQGVASPNSLIVALTTADDLSSISQTVSQTISQATRQSLQLSVA